VSGRDSAAVAVDPLLGIDIAAHEPGDVGLPGEGTRPGGLEDQFEGGLRPVFRLQLPMVVVIAEANSFRLEALRDLPEFTAERTPAIGGHVALFGRNGRHVEMRETQCLARVHDGIGLLAQCRHADVAGRGL
jgi:hypothetical protein